MPGGLLAGGGAGAEGWGGPGGGCCADAGDGAGGLWLGLLDDVGPVAEEPGGTGYVMDHLGDVRGGGMAHQYPSRYQSVARDLLASVLRAAPLPGGGVTARP